MTRESLWNSIAKSIRLQQSMGKTVWLVVHFPDTYVACQEMLEANDIDYCVETETVSQSWYLERASIAGPHVSLLLGDLIAPLGFEDGEIVGDAKVAVMVVERHPYKPMDDQLRDFANSLPAAKVEVGYFLGLDDEIVTRLVPRQMIDLLKAMGLNDQELITSSLVTRRLTKLIERTSKTAKRVEGAESAADWFQSQEQQAGGSNLPNRNS